MEPKATKPQPPVSAYPKDLVRLAESDFDEGSEKYAMLVDAAYEMDLLYLKATALESRAQQLEAKLYGIALIMRP